MTGAEPSFQETKGIVEEVCALIYSGEATPRRLLQMQQDFRSRNLGGHADLVFMLSTIYRARDPQMSNSNEFHFHDSKIANFNLGQQIGTINASIGLLNQQGAEAADLARSLEIIRDAVVAAPDADEKRKKHILDSLSLIGAEAEKPKDDRQDGILQPVLTNLEKLLSTTSSLENLWHTHGPAITQFFSYMLGTS